VDISSHELPAECELAVSEQAGFFEKPGPSVARTKSKKINGEMRDLLWLVTMLRDLFTNAKDSVILL
jgi:hypothetical protein